MTARKNAQPDKSCRTRSLWVTNFRLQELLARKTDRQICSQRCSEITAHARYLPATKGRAPYFLRRDAEPSGSRFSDRCTFSGARHRFFAPVLAVVQL